MCAINAAACSADLRQVLQSPIVSFAGRSRNAGQIEVETTAIVNFHYVRIVRVHVARECSVYIVYSRVCFFIATFFKTRTIAFRIFFVGTGGISIDRYLSIVLAKKD